MRKWRNTCVLFLACICLVLLWGCGKANETEAKPRDNIKQDAKADGEMLKKAALAYWNNRLVTRDYQASYGREAKTGLPSFEEYVQLVSRNEKFKFSSLKADEPKVDQNTGKLKISLMAKGPGMPAAFDRSFKDKWIFSTSDGWLHLFSKDQP